MLIPAQAYIAERIRIEDRGHSTACWIWQLFKTAKGYGLAHWAGQVRAHRLSYESHFGPIPANHEIDHLCHNPACVNPVHLEAVTPEENRRRQTLNGRCGGFVSRRTHCQRGHEFTAENTLFGPAGRRRCRRCWNTYQNQWRKAAAARKDSGGSEAASSSGLGRNVRTHRTVVDNG